MRMTRDLAPKKIAGRIVRLPAHAAAGGGQRILELPLGEHLASERNRRGARPYPRYNRLGCTREIRGFTRKPSLRYPLLPVTLAISASEMPIARHASISLALSSSSDKCSNGRSPLVTSSLLP